MDFAFGLAAAVLSGLGVGSGGLLVIYLTMLGEYEQITAQGLNLLFFLFSSGAAMLYHLTHRNINFGVVMVLVGFGLVGAAAGTMLLNLLGGELVRKIFGGMLIFSGVTALKGARNSPQPSRHKGEL
ncbi:MAG: sulfite exporter TauE/SafE family protein [Clostridia bacterium]|nr:sulfite exporter TauE/SafE family protein [Clostridia bacterium]